MEGPNKFPTEVNWFTMAGDFLVTRSVLVVVRGVYGENTIGDFGNGSLG